MAGEAQERGGAAGDDWADALPLTLAAAQSVPHRDDLGANIEAHLRLIQAAAREEARLVLFPELSLTGYELDLARACALKPGDPWTERLAEAAAYHDVTVVAGAPLLVDSRLHLGALVFTPDGRELLYTKRHLGAFSAEANPEGDVPPPEPSVFEPGDSDPLVPIGAGGAGGELSAALAICADTGQPEHARAAVERGARIYLASMFVIPRDLEAESACLAGYAREHGLVVVMANHGGPTGGLPSGGGSAVWSETGELVARFEGEGTGLVVARRTADGWEGRTRAVELG